MDEHLTRSIPRGRDEILWARHRPAPHRTPHPAVGDTVLYRHDEWVDPVDAEVLWVQPLYDVDDPNVCTVQLDETGAVVLIEGRPVVAVLDDPWPTLRLKTRPYGVVITREARLRGAAGWLPLDWQSRHRPQPRVAVPPTPPPTVPAPASEGW